MLDLWGFLVLLFLLSLPASLIALAFRKGRSKAKKIAPICAIGLVASFIAFGITSARDKAEQRAREQGYASADDQRAAEKKAEEERREDEYRAAAERRATERKAVEERRAAEQKAAEERRAADQRINEERRPDGTADTPRVAAASATPTAKSATPAYCGTKATERLPECGWTEKKQAAIDQQDDARKTAIKDSEACGIAQIFVEAALKSPSTAKFPWSCNAKLAGANKWEVSGYVDSQNSFGAAVRSYYVVTVRPEEWLADRWRWKLLSISLN